MNKNILLITKDNSFIIDYVSDFFDKTEIIYKNSDIKQILRNKNLTSVYLLGMSSLFKKIIKDNNKKKICWIFNYSFADLADIKIRNHFYEIIEYIERKQINSFGCQSNEVYSVMKNASYSVEKIDLFTQKCLKEKTNTKSKYVGLISNQIIPNENFYNQLASFSNADNIVKILNPNKTTIDFCNRFNIKFKKVKTYKELLKNNIVNLYVNFSYQNNLFVFISIANCIPCIIGNNSIYNKSNLLRENLVVNSNDNINEIKEKVTFTLNNRKRIIDEYDKYYGLYKQK